MDIAHYPENMPPCSAHLFTEWFWPEMLTGGTPETSRKKYFKWFNKAFSFKAGKKLYRFIDTRLEKKSIWHMYPKINFDFLR